MSAIIERYSKLAIIFHWLIALLIIGNLALGFLRESFGDENVRFMINSHKSVGITILGLAIMRLLWRITHRPPTLPTTYQRWEKIASHAVHWLLYALIFALPITGWLQDSAWKKATEIKMYWFGLFEWPRIGWIMEMEPAAKETFHDVIGQRHEMLGWTLIALLVLHIGGALKHQFLDKEPELQRMWR